MNMLFCVLIYLTNFTYQHVNSKVITINTTGGSDRNKCCVKGECPCSSLSNALQNMTSNTVINITSQSVKLHSTITMGLYQHHLNAVTITGNGATIVCNKNGSIYCESCHNLIIEEIKMHKCGTSYVFAGLYIKNSANITVFNCDFLYSTDRAVALDDVYHNVTFTNCNFVSKSDYNIGFSIYTALNQSVNLEIHRCNVYYHNFDVATGVGGATKTWNITISQTNFSSNPYSLSIVIRAWKDVSIMFKEVLFYNNPTGIYLRAASDDGIVVLSILDSVFTTLNSIFMGLGSDFWNNTLIINNTNFTSMEDNYSPLIGIECGTAPLCLLSLNHLYITNSKISNVYDSDNTILGILSIKSPSSKTNITLDDVSMLSNICKTYKGSTLYIDSTSETLIVTFNKCNFSNNTSVRGAAASIDSHYEQNRYFGAFKYAIKNSVFDHNVADESVIYVAVTASTENAIQLNSSTFSNNVGVCIYFSRCSLGLTGNILFINNTADSGGALHLDEASFIWFDGDVVNVSFVDNSAISHGGAIFVELNYGCNRDHTTFTDPSENTVTTVSFVNSKQLYDANSLYFSVSKYCRINTTCSDSHSEMYVPYKFHYFQIINGTSINIPYDYNYTQLTVPNFPVMTSPHQLKLYKLDGDYIQFLDYITDKILGCPVKFYGIVLDYFDKPAESTGFHVQCLDNYTLINNLLVFDNVSPLNVILVGREISNSTNVTLLFHSEINHYFQQIEVILTIELVPCYHHPAYTYNKTLERCVCYHHGVVECYDDYNEIKRSYWFGSVNGKATTSLCPSEYCMFVNRKKTREGYFELPQSIDYQCDHHRSGPACGECSPGYTLAYDSTDCISEDHCSTGMTVLVVVLTCLYWIILVGGVFFLMYFNFQLSSGYFYGIIYYYSMVGILLGNNPYISSGAAQFITIFSDISQLNPRFLGKLCLVQRMSGIDQLFIHYCHAGAVSALLFAFVVAANSFRRVSELISRCIIRVFCLLLLLAYTSLSSTSLQLLRPLTFTDIDAAYTYSSPNIKYFRGRHALYGSVAVICELVIGIGLPFILLLEPFLNRKINFIKFKPILDQFQGCYKKKHYWFASYYLICRQVIMLIVLLGNSNYGSMLFYLLVTCVVIATVHMWFRPYKNKLLNIFDGLLLQFMLLVVIISTFDFLQSASTVLVVVLVTLPLLLICTTASINKVVHYKRHHYIAINDESDDDNGDEDQLRYVSLL